MLREPESPTPQRALRDACVGSLAVSLAASACVMLLVSLSRPPLAAPDHPQTDSVWSWLCGFVLGGVLWLTHRMASREAPLVPFLRGLAWTAAIALSTAWTLQTNLWATSGLWISLVAVALAVCATWPSPRGQVVPPSLNLSWYHSLFGHPRTSFTLDRQIVDGATDSLAGLFAQRQERFHDDVAGDSLRGELQVTFAAGQRDAETHVSFCPPFPTLPEAVVEPEREDARVTISECLWHGMRLEVRLPHAAKALKRVRLRYRVVCPRPLVDQEVVEKPAKQVAYEVAPREARHAGGVRK